ncbi:hypothetical protein ACTXGQ_11925 [Marinobacter sp. 1Y8]
MPKEPLIKSIGNSASFESLPDKARIAGNGRRPCQGSQRRQDGSQDLPEGALPAIRTLR